MPDYNKGDFTQQGIDGFVEGGLHLNEKRCLTAKISTDEEAEGLNSVEINIHDHLNDLEYSISGENLTVGENVIGIIPSGNIAITENTVEPLDISEYATVTVNVQSGLQPSSATQKTLDNFGYTCVYDSEYKEYNYDSYTLPFIMNIKTGAVNYTYDNTEGTTACTLSGDGKVSIGDPTLTDTPFYITIRLAEHAINIVGVDSNAHHITISFTADGYPISINTITNSDEPYIYVNESLTKTYYLYLDPLGDGTATRSGVIYTDLTNGIPQISIVKFAGGPK